MSRTQQPGPSRPMSTHGPLQSRDNDDDDDHVSIWSFSQSVRGGSSGGTGWCCCFGRRGDRSDPSGSDPHQTRRPSLQPLRPTQIPSDAPPPRILPLSSGYHPHMSERQAYPPSLARQLHQEWSDSWTRTEQVQAKEDTRAEEAQEEIDRGEEKKRDKPALRVDTGGISGSGGGK